MARKKARQQSRIELVLQDDDIAEFKLNERKHSKRFALPVIMLFIWAFLYVFVVCFSIVWHQQGTGVDLIENNAAHEFSIFVESLGGLFGLVFGAGDPYMLFTCVSYLSVALAGAALAVCGAIFQGSFKNVLAGPSTMGVMSGGSLGCMVFIVLELVSSPFPGGTAGRVLFTLAGCAGSVALVLGVSLAAGRGKVSTSAMIIAGTVFSGVASNILLLVQYFILALVGANEYGLIMQDFGRLMMGHFFTSDSVELLLSNGFLGMAGPILVCVVFLCVIAGKLNVLSLGEDEARSMGVNVSAWRSLMIVIGTILTAVVVAYCGRIGFVGFMVPLVMRRLTGPDMKRLIPCAAVGGAIFLTAIVYIARLVDMADYISVITGPVGCVVMIVALMRKRGDSRAVADGGAGANMGLR